MSKAITIQQKGVAQNITVDKLQVHKAGGTAYWVPEDTVELHALTATANGEYSAASAGKYGYGYASVSVPGSSVTGTGSDGNQHVITTDGSGAIVDTKVPSEIRIITPPDYVGPYGDGAYISFEGLTVEAFYADGTSAGVIDPQDLSFPVTVARYDDVSDYYSKDGINAERFLCSIQTLKNDSGSAYVYVAANTISPGCKVASSDVGSIIWLTIYDNAVYAFIPSDSNSGAFVFYAHGAPPIKTGSEDDWIIGTSFRRRDEYVDYEILAETYNEKIGLTIDLFTIPVSTVNPRNAEAPMAQQMIPVQYSRPGDGLVLEDSFWISVVPGPSGGDD